MNKYRFVQLDVFTEEPFTGNALAVFPEAEGLSDDEMMKIAREMNLSETVFVLKPETADRGPQTAEDSQQSTVSGQPSALRRLRIFTP
ncbi:MAG: PhzF family phenazine biosynthesis protein, partial [Pyrinomonadaceae bacterium]